MLRRGSQTVRDQVKSSVHVCVRFKLQGGRKLGAVRGGVVHKEDEAELMKGMNI